MRIINDLLNKNFGMLKVIEMTEERRNGNIVWLCKCDCGRFKKMTAKHILGLKNQHCGCQKIARNRKPIIKPKTYNCAAMESRKSKLGTEELSIERETDITSITNELFRFLDLEV